MLLKGDRNSQSIDVSLITPQKIPMLNASPASIAETNWKFVNQVKTNTPGRPRYPNSVNEALSLTELKGGGLVIRTYSYSERIH